jgi:hypothetical protein
MRPQIVPLLKLTLVFAMILVVVEARPLFDWMCGRADADTRMFNAIGLRDMTALETALVDGASPVAMGCADMPPLVYAACIGNAPAARRLLASGADVNAPDWTGMTPLMWAATQERVELIDLLLRAGADPSRRDRTHRTALQMAMERGADRAVEALSCDPSMQLLAEK